MSAKKQITEIAEDVLLWCEHAARLCGKKVDGYAVFLVEENTGVQIRSGGPRVVTLSDLKALAASALSISRKAKK